MPDPPPPPLPRDRVGSVRLVTIPPRVKAALDAGRDETRTLQEWLAVDLAKLAGAALPAAGLREVWEARRADGRRSFAGAACMV